MKGIEEKMKMKEIKVTTNQINEWATAHRQNRMFYSEKGKVYAFKDPNIKYAGYYKTSFPFLAPSFTVMVSDNGEPVEISWKKIDLKKGDYEFTDYKPLADYIVKIWG